MSARSTRDRQSDLGEDLRAPFQMNSGAKRHGPGPKSTLRSPMAAVTLA